jgi:alkylhydroperoxidase/carboxymuconolactone decarboxylase family protein YurZ
VIETCVNNCLKSGASSLNIKEVLQQAILMAEVPMDIYTNTVNNAIKKYKSKK